VTAPLPSQDRELDDGTDDEPAPKKKMSKLVLWLIIGGAVLLTLVAAVLAAYFLVIKPASDAADQLDQLMMPGMQQQLLQIPAQPGALQQGTGIPTVPVVPTVPATQPAPAAQ
jgi:Tfp pilus assembly protein PilN